MAKRFIDTDLFKDPFVRGLEAPLKPLWVYLFCDCNASGIWNVELDVAKLRCGVPYDYPDEKIKEAFSSKIIEIENGEKWFLPSFVKIQYNNELKGTNPATKKVISELLSYGLIEEIEAGIYALTESPLKAPTKPLESPLLNSKKPPLKNKKGTKDMDKEKEKDKDEGKGTKFQNLDFVDITFRSLVNEFIRYRRQDIKKPFKTERGVRQFYEELVKLSGNNLSKASQLVEHAKSHEWMTVYPIKNGKTARKLYRNESVTEYDDKL